MYEKEQFRIYLQSLVDDYNKRARGMKNNSLLCTDRIYEKSKARLNGAITAAELLTGKKINIVYAEPTYYYSEVILKF